MIEHKDIHSGETGLSVRTKLNAMLSELILGSEGVNRAWESLRSLNQMVKANGEGIEELLEEIQHVFDDIMRFVNREVDNLYTYVNTVAEGVSGFAEGADFKPNFPEDVAATVIGVGPGTFTYLLDENGNPITISEVCIVMFFRAAGSTYWKYNTIMPEFQQIEVAGSFGESESKVMNQKFFTEKVKNVAGGTIDVSNIATLDDYGLPSTGGVYVLKKGTSFAGHLIVSCNLDASMVYQTLFGGFSAVNGSLSVGRMGTLAYRVKNISSLDSDVPMGSWSGWKMFQDDFMQVLSEEEYAALEQEGLVKDKLYFIYE